MVTSHPLPLPRRDPIARYAWIALVVGAVWINVRAFQPPAQAQDGGPGVIIYQATPTPSLPTPALAAPALSLAQPTAAPPSDQPIETPALAAPGGAGGPEGDTGGQDSGLLPQIDPQPAYDPTLHPAEAAAALTAAYQDLPTAGAAPDASTEAAAREYQRRRLDSGAYRPQTR
jgi:hypothetical protein